MKNLIDSKKIDFGLIAVFLLSTGICWVDLAIGRRVMVILFLLLTIFYLLRMIFSFFDWKVSKGIACLNFLLNFQIFYALLGICYVAAQWPGALMVSRSALGSMVVLAVITGIYLMARWAVINKNIFWIHLKDNVIKAILLSGICALLSLSLTH